MRRGGPGDAFERPQIAIANTASDLTPCNAHLTEVARSVANGVHEAGGIPLELPVVSLGETNVRPTAMLWRNMAAMATEEMLRANTMGTASTMALVSEALGVVVPGVAGTPAPDSRLLEAAHGTGRLAVELIAAGRRPSTFLTKANFHNAIVALAAIGGSTNAVVHLLAIAGRLGIELTLDDFDRIGSRVPVLVDLLPAGRFLMDDLHRAGGLLAVLREVRDLLDASALTVTGKPLVDYLDDAPIWDPEVIRPRTKPFVAEGGIAVLRGNLAPAGALIKPAAASPELLRHRGR